MAGIADTIRIERYGTPADELAPEDVVPELEDCGAGLSAASLLWWPKVPQD